VAAQTVSDSTFLDANWTGTQFVAGNGGTSTGAQVLAGGNPGPYRNVTDQLNAAPAGGQTIVLSTHIYAPFTYDPAVSGAIGSLNYAEDAACTSGCFGDGQSTGPALAQGGNFYILSSSSVITGSGLAWLPHTLNALTAADFGLVNVTQFTIFDNTQHPNFSTGGAPIQFGFFRANGTSVNGGGYTLAAGIDNWQTTIVAAAPPTSRVEVPAVRNIGLGILAGTLALFALVFLRRGRHSVLQSHPQRRTPEGMSAPSRRTQRSATAW
jgi:hypothetical protein